MLLEREIFGGLGNRMFQHSYIYAQARSGKIPDIYLQNESYFAPYKDEIRKIFGQELDKIDMVSLHVRRGDYNNNPFYVNLQNTDYYDDAIALFPGEKFLVFCADRQEGSDDKADMEWCKQRFQGKQFEFYQGVSEIDDFNAQASCKAHIMANSSFSWWAAYVSGNKTVCPTDDKWFSDGQMRISIPNQWIRI